MIYILHLLNPFLSGIYSFINLKDRRSLIVLYLWFIIFGIGFVSNNEFLDSYRYTESFEEQKHYLDFATYVSEVKDYFTFETDTKDIYTLTVNFLVSQFTDNYHWTFFIYAIVFGFFYIKSLQYLIPFFSRTPFYYILLFLFCFSNPIFNINGVRFWTAAWIGVYALFKIFIDRKYTYYALLAVTPLIHGAFVVWIIMVLFAQFIPKPKTVWIVLYVLSLFVSVSSSLSLLSDYSDIMPTYLSNMLWSYTESDAAIEKMERMENSTSPLYAQILNALPNLILIALTIALILKWKELENNSTHSRLIDIYLVIVTIVNFTMSVPSVGVRFQKLTIPLLVFIWANNIEKLKRIRWMLYLVPLAFSYKVLYWMRYMISVTELELYVYPVPATIIRYLFNT